jgi:hypothetical protein
MRWLSRPRTDSHLFTEQGDCIVICMVQGLLGLSASGSQERPCGVPESEIGYNMILTAFPTKEMR